MPTNMTKMETIYLNESPAAMSWIRVACTSLIRYAVVTLACVSILVMSAESLYFPWPNLAGAGILALMVRRANRRG